MGAMKTISLLIPIILLMGNVQAEPNLSGTDPIQNIGENSYGITNIVDGSRTSAFCVSGKKKMWLKFVGHRVNGLGFINGYDKSQDSYLNNSRPKTLMITVNGQRRQVILADTAMPQWVSLEDEQPANVLIEVQNVYRGYKYSDVCLSEVLVDQLVFKNYQVLVSGARLSSVYEPDQMNSEQNSNAILKAYGLLLSKPDEKFLNNLLADIEYSGTGEVYNAEFNESLKELVEEMIRKYPDIVLKTISSANNSVKNIIIGAWFNILGFTKYDTTQELLDSNDAEPSMKRFAKGILKYVGESSE